MRRHLRQWIIIGALFLAPLGTASVAQARYLYWELGVGLGSFSGGNDAFSGVDLSTASYTFAANVGLYYTLVRTRWVEFHLGAKSRMTSVSLGATELEAVASVISISPQLRIETKRFYVGGGYIPYAFKRYDTGFGFLPTGVLANQLWGWSIEGGLIWRAAPMFHIALEFGMEYYHINTTPFNEGTVSPSTLWQGGLQFRFFPFSYPKMRGQQEGPSSEFDGWRYPFGINKK